MRHDGGSGSAAASFDYASRTYYFCSQHCLHRFQSPPGKSVVALLMPGLFPPRAAHADGIEVAMESAGRTCSSPSSTTAWGVPLAAGVLYPFFGLLLSPIVAAAAMSFSSVSVVGNALRRNRVRL